MVALPGRRTRLQRWILGVLLGLIGLTAALAGFLVILEWRPEPVMMTPVEGTCLPGPAPATLTLLSWNIGYAGLDDQADFFMDGGKQVRARSREAVLENLAGITDFLRQNRADLVLIQEVDRDSSRTFGIDEAEILAPTLPEHCRAYAPNSRVRWIPYPFLEPLGRVESGLLSFSRFRLQSAARIQLPGAFPWPVRVFQLKRCLHELRLGAPDGRDWVILHQHLSTFDPGGTLRRQEMAFLKDRILGLLQEGHHVIVAGDWNQSFPGVADRQFPSAAGIPDWFQRVPADWTPEGFAFAFDVTTPSLRATDRPYAPGQNFLTIVDGFLVGPDIEVRAVVAYDLKFAHSDHHPVRLEVSLRASGP